VVALLEDVSVAFFRLVAIVMKAAPVGAFGAMAFTIGKYGIDSLANLVHLVLTFYPPRRCSCWWCWAWSRGWRVFDPAADRLSQGGTAAGAGHVLVESALPALIEKMERAGCPKAVVGLVVPTGYSFNLDGTNIYMTLAALFIAQACNVELTLGQQVLLLGVAMLSSKGAAG
jgi:aerobic C4-dicarboxylate transport protein